MKPRFIVLEGIDGAGKTTQTKLLCEALGAIGVSCVPQSEPTGSGYGVRIRRALSGDEQYRTDAEGLARLFTLDREAHSAEIVKYLDSGISVVCDRYYYSTFAYQGTEVSFDAIAKLSFTDRIRQPDICVFLDMDPEKGFERIGARGGGREIYEDPGTLRNVRGKFAAAFDYIASAPGRNEHIVTVDALGTEDEVADRVFAAVAPLFGEKETEETDRTDETAAGDVSGK
ncbi:MAG: dTMP kinase [Clostridia bacterium]|nr:dTMP kinase [Clostridia bacterium]